MAEAAEDDDKALAGAEEAQVVEVEGADETPKEPTEAERVARHMGWKPPSEWKGDASNFKSAEDFLKEVPEIMKNMRRNAERQNDKLARVVAEVAKLNKNQQRALDADLAAQLEDAVENGDKDRAKKILDFVKATAEPETGAPDAFSEFKTRNTWYDTDDIATAYAERLDRQFAPTGKVDDAEAHFRKIEAAVKSKFPALFGAKAEDDAEPKKRQAPVIGAGSRTSANRSSDALTAADLTKAHRQAADQYGVSYADYAASLNKINAAEKATA